MDYNDLWAEIQANPACLPHIHTNEMPKLSAQDAQVKDQAIADILNAERIRIVDCEVGEGRISEAMGIPQGPVFIYNLRNAALAPLPDNPSEADIIRKAMTEQAWRLIDKASLNVGSPSVRAGIDAFISFGLISAEGAAAVKSLAEVPETVSAADVSRAVRGPRGDE